MPVRRTPIRYRPMGHMPCEMHTHEMHAHKVQAHGTHACEIHAHEMRAHKVQAHETHVYEVYAHEMYTHEMHDREMHAYERQACTIHTHEIHAYEVYPYEIHTREMHTCKTPAHEMHTRKMHTREIYAHRSMAFWGYGAAELMCLRSPATMTSTRFKDNEHPQPHRGQNAAILLNRTYVFAAFGAKVAIWHSVPRALRRWGIGHFSQKPKLRSRLYKIHAFEMHVYKAHACMRCTPHEIHVYKICT
jgi:hypothetical protein